MKKLLAPLLLSAGALTFNGCITAIRQTYLKAVDPRTLEMQLKDDKTKLWWGAANWFWLPLAGEQWFFKS